MAEAPVFDTQFALPACDDPPTTEIGVIVMGLPAEQLLAGLGLAAMVDDPAAVVLLMDRVRHAGAIEFTREQCVAAGLDRWRSARPELTAAGKPPQSAASLRHVWADAHDLAGRCFIGALSPASIVYLAACWLRAPEVDAYADAVSETSGLPRITPAIHAPAAP